MQNPPNILCDGIEKKGKRKGRDMTMYVRARPRHRESWGDRKFPDKRPNSIANV